MSKGNHAPNDLKPGNLKRRGASFFRRDENGNFVATPTRPARPANNTNNAINPTDYPVLTKKFTS